MNSKTYVIDLTPDEHRALQAYARIHGRTWKASLRQAWLNASEPGILQALRNSSRFGPRGLASYSLIDHEGDGAQ